MPTPSTHCTGAGESRSLADVDRHLAVLNHPIRRRVIEHLLGVPGARATVDELAKSLELPYQRVDQSGRRKRLDLQLHHVHLPKLARASVVEFDPERGIVQYHGSDDLERWLGIIRRWQYRSGGSDTDFRSGTGR